VSPTLSSGAPAEEDGRWVLVLAAGALFLGMWLRCFGLEIQSLWLDEFMAFSIGQQPLDVLWRRAGGITGQSPFYYVILRV
jgi:hypothetical protein